MKSLPDRTAAGAQYIRFAVSECTLGAILVASSDAGICAIGFGDDVGALTRDIRTDFPQAERVERKPAVEHLLALVLELVEDPASAPHIKLDIDGTPFQCRVWQNLQTIPAGETASYSDIAARIGLPGSARAVARACAANRIAVAIPCHRVVRANGGLSGYRWGIERKRELLAREAGHMQASQCA